MLFFKVFRDGSLFKKGGGTKEKRVMITKLFLSMFFYNINISIPKHLKVQNLAYPTLRERFE